MVKLFYSLSVTRKWLQDPNFVGWSFLCSGPALFSILYCTSFQLSSNILKESAQCYLWYGHVSFHFWTKCEQPYFNFQKGQQNEPGLAVKKTKVLLSYKIYNHYFRKSPFKNCISILLHYLDWYQKKIDQGNRKYSWKIWMMHGAWWNMNELQFFA